MRDIKIDHCAIVILAAGASTRLGRSKQLLSFKGKSLLKNAVDNALKTGCSPVVAVLGANSKLLLEELKNIPVTIVENSGWQEGMASSIRCGVEKVLNAAPNTDGIIFMVCDQPYLDSSLLSGLIEKQKNSGMPIVGSHYGNKTGTPALFHKTIFADLMKLDGESGAGKLIMKNPEMVATVDFPEGIIDIDTIEDYNKIEH